MKEEKTIDRLESFGYALQARIDKRIADRQTIEDRWLKDLRRYHGKNTPDEDERLTKAKKSRIVVNITRNKCNAAEARLVDLLFPTDDKNWGIRPTPVPDLINAQPAPPAQGMPSLPSPVHPQRQDGLSPLPDQTPGQPLQEQPQTTDKFQPGQQHGQPQLPGQPPLRQHSPGGISGQPTTPGQKPQDVHAIAKKKADVMEKEIEDQLVEANYAAVCRDMIHDAVVLGTGVLKGPNVVNRVRKKWQQIDGVSVLEIVEDLSPGVSRVSPWNFFPDLNAKSIETASDVFERKLLNKKQLRDLAKRPGYLRDQIKKLLMEDSESEHTTKNNLDQIREIAGTPSVTSNGMYELWEYHGPVEYEDLIAAGIEVDDLEENPLIAPQAIIIFCNRHILKASLNPLETEDLPYSVFCWEEDESSIFGYGVTYRMESPQKVINASWRMLMDNAGISIAPQIVMDKEAIEPADGKWEITGRKIWYKTEQAQSVTEAFGLFEISSHQAELVDIFMRARQLADEETNLPLIAQGEQSANVTQTARGMSMLMKSANTVLRRAVRSYDDNITQPMITRFYDWNMQNSKKDEIKGDFNVKARGSSELAERAIMEQGIEDLVNLATSQVFAPMTDMREMYRRICKAKKVDPDGLIKPENEVQQPGTPPEVQIEKQKLQAQQQEAQQNFQLEEAKLQQKAQYDQAKLKTDYDIGMAKLALQENLTTQQLQGKLGTEQQKMQHDKEITGARNMTELAKIEQQERELKFKAQTGRQGI